MKSFITSNRGSGLIGTVVLLGVVLSLSIAVTLLLLSSNFNKVLSDRRGAMAEQLNKNAILIIKNLMSNGEIVRNSGTGLWAARVGATPNLLWNFVATTSGSNGTIQLHQCDPRAEVTLLGTGVPSDFSTCSKVTTTGEFGTLTAGFQVVSLRTEIFSNQAENRSLVFQVPFGSTGPAITFNQARAFDYDANAALLAPDGSGKIYIGGSFKGYRTTATNGILRLNADLTPDLSFAFGSGFTSSSYSVKSIQSVGDGTNDIYVGGSFTKYQGLTVSNLIRLHSDGSRETTFTPIFYGGAFTTMSPITGGTYGLYVAGSFKKIDKTTFNRIAKLKTDGAIDTTFNVGTGTDGPVMAITRTTDGTGDIYVGGAFTKYNGTAKSGIVRLKSDGTIITTFNIGTGFTGSISASATSSMSVKAIAIANDGSNKIYVVGNFTSYNGTARKGIARLSPDGSLDATFNPGTGFPFDVAAQLGPSRLAIATDSSGDIYVAGSFTSFNGSARNALVRINSNGTLDTGFVTGSGIGIRYWFRSNVSQILPITGASGDILVVGEFTNYNGIGIDRMMKLRADGTIHRDSPTGSGFDFPPSSIESLTNNSGKVYVAGDFQFYNGKSSKGIIRLNADGTVDSSFNVGTGATYAVDGNARGATFVKEAPEKNGDVYLGGEFEDYNGTAKNSFVRLKSDGTINTAFNIGTGFQVKNTTNTTVRGHVRYILPYTDNTNRILVSGWFDSYNGTAKSCIVRLNPNGTIDSTFNIGSGATIDPGETFMAFPNIDVMAFSPDGSGKIYAIGGFTLFNGTARRSIVRLNANGSVDSSFVINGVSVTSRLYGIYPIPGASGKILVGGESSAGGTFRLNNNGALDTTFSPDPLLKFLSDIIPFPDGSGDLLASTGNLGSARITPNGVIIPSYATSLANRGMSGPFAFTLDGTGDIFAGGQGFYRNTVVDRFSRITTDGTIR